MNRAMRTMKEALSEVSRELGVRRRCYSRWVSDGKLSDIDAEDRMARLETAREIIERAIQNAELVSDTAVSAFSAGAETARKMVRIEGFTPAVGVVMRQVDETDASWAERVRVAQRRAEAGLPAVSPELVT